MLLIMGNKNYSSWSLRPWLLMKHVGLTFAERVLPLDTAEFTRDVGAVSPTRWPRDRAARAVARAVCAEMHSGFSVLRSQWPMNARATDRHTAPSAERQAEMARIEDLWDDCRSRFGAHGPWLFGEFSVADAMYAPVVLRFRTYGADVRESARTYMATVLADTHMLDWLAAAAAEHLTIEASEIGRQTNANYWRPS
jgi:glutathione S-transferase